MNTKLTKDEAEVAAMVASREVRRADKKERDARAAWKNANERYLDAVRRAEYLGTAGCGDSDMADALMMVQGTAMDLVRAENRRRQADDEAWEAAKLFINTPRSA